MHVATNPCASCPYRRDTPPGVWAEEEYAKLPLYDDNRQEAFGLFMCHNGPLTETETVCRGWLTVARESAAARIAVLKGKVTDEQRYADVGVDLYTTGQEAYEVGVSAIEIPGLEAVRISRKIVKQREKKGLPA